MWRLRLLLLHGFCVFWARLGGWGCSCCSNGTSVDAAVRPQLRNVWHGWNVLHSLSARLCAVRWHMHPGE